MKVKLIAHTPEPEKLVAAAAKLCYSPATIDTILDGLTEEKTEAFLGRLESYGHMTPIEHASFTFAIEGVSRSLLAQITRHRLASFSVQSQRYVKENNFSFVTPPEIAADPEAAELFQRNMRNSWNDYLALAERLQQKHMAEMMAAGMDEKKARSAAEKKAIEDARYVLPNACETKMIFTMNTRSLHNFFALRCCNRAQWEIRELAWEMLRQCREVCPMLFRSAGPACLRGACTEGAMTCGKSNEIRERSEQLGE